MESREVRKGEALFQRRTVQVKALKRRRLTCAESHSIDWRAHSRVETVGEMTLEG